MIFWITIVVWLKPNFNSIKQLNSNESKMNNYYGNFSTTKTCPMPYKGCNLGKPGHINVHIISHTHDDVGWVKTIDEYYYGSKNAPPTAYTVQKIIGRL